MTSTDAATVFVIDDDEGVRQSVEDLLNSVGLRAESYATAEEFLHRKHPDGPSCLVLDVRLPGMSGIDLHRQLMARSCNVPAIFITAHGYDERTRSQTYSDWTVACLTKPFSEDELFDAVQAALKWQLNS